LSTPLLAFVIIVIPFGTFCQTVIANLIGGLIFFWVDKWIFRKKEGREKPKRILATKGCGNARPSQSISE